MSDVFYEKCYCFLYVLHLIFFGWMVMIYNVKKAKLLC